jgi:DNA-binding NarL/FixJ family response regulator
MDNPRDVVATERSVVIVGAVSLQNKLLAKLIAQTTSYACAVRSPDEARALSPGAAALVLLDAAELGPRVQILCQQRGFAMLALINAEDSLALDALVACPGLRGVFFTDASEEHLAKGIAAIFRGEYWLPRRVLCAHLERTRGAEPVASALAPGLTQKELQTLTLLATGRSTEHIAQELRVSPHTVKTHIYNLFRKIKVTNRVQAAHWAAQNLALPGLRALR